MRRNIIHVCINVSVKNKRRKMFRDVAPACLWISSALSLFCWRYSLVVCAGTHAVHWDAGARMHCWPGCIQRHSPSQPLAVRSRSSLAPAIAAAAKASGCFFYRRDACQLLCYAVQLVMRAYVRAFFLSPPSPRCFPRPRPSDMNFSLVSYYCIIEQTICMTASWFTVASNWKSCCVVR